jgi:hypothetical protein
MESGFDSNSTNSTNFYSSRFFPTIFFIPEYFQRLTCSNFKQVCQEKIQKLLRSIRKGKTFNNKSHFIRKFIKYIPIPLFLDVPDQKFFARLLKYLQEQVLSVYSILYEAFDESISKLPSSSNLIEVLLFDIIIPSEQFPKEIFDVIYHAINKSVSQDFEELVDIVFYILLKYQSFIIASIVSNEFSSSQSPDFQLEVSSYLSEQEDIISPEIIIQSTLKISDPLISAYPSSTPSINSINDLVEEECNNFHTTEEYIPTISASSYSINLNTIEEPTVEKCIVDASIILEYSSLPTIKYIVSHKNLSHSSLVGKQKIFLFFSFYYYQNTFLGSKLRWLETLSHCPMIVASDVVSVG